MAGHRRRRRRRRRCKFCPESFLPDPHIKNQRACGRASCVEMRADEARQKWLRRTANRSYFVGRYAYLKTWLQKPENRDYLKRYRRDRQRKAEAARRSAQVPAKRRDDQPSA